MQWIHIFTLLGFNFFKIEEVLCHFSKFYDLLSATLSADDYHKLLQKIAVLETKIHRLEVNVEVNRQMEMRQL